MSDFSADLVAGLAEAGAFLDGAVTGSRVTLVDAPDVRSIRRTLRMSQQRFAEAFRIPLATLKNWEQGRRLPDAPASAYLQVIAREPEVIRKALGTPAPGVPASRHQTAQP